MPPPRRPQSFQRICELPSSPDPSLLAKLIAKRIPPPYDHLDLCEGCKRAIQHVDEALEVLEGYEIGGVMRYKLEEIMGEDVPAWVCDFLGEVLRYIGERPVKSNSGRLAQDTLRVYGRELIAVNQKVAYNTIDYEERKRVYQILEDLVKEYSLAIYGYDRAQIGFGTLNALLTAVPMSGLGWSRNMSHLLFQALASYTGLRPDHLARARVVSVLKRPTYNSLTTGGDSARLRDFTLGYRRATLNDAPEIYGWFKPRGGKTAQSRGLSFSLSPVAILGQSPAALVLIYAGHQGV